jgi:hypothetical protein
LTTCSKRRGFDGDKGILPVSLWIQINVLDARLVARKIFVGPYNVPQRRIAALFSSHLISSAPMHWGSIPQLDSKLHMKALSSKYKTLAARAPECSPRTHGAADPSVNADKALPSRYP